MVPKSSRQCKKEKPASSTVSMHQYFLPHFLMNPRTCIAVSTTALALLTSVPALAQTTTPTTTPSPSACSAALQKAHTAHTTAMDARHAAMKAAKQKKHDAIIAALALTDETARKEAIQKALKDFQTTMQSMTPETDDTMKSVKDACKGILPAMRGGMMKGKMKGMNMMRGMDDDSDDESEGNMMRSHGKGRGKMMKFLFR